MINTLIISIILILVLAGYLILSYNSLVTLRMRVKEAFSDIDVQLKKRYDLLPDLVEVAKKATKVDKEILTEITKLRSQAMEESSKKSSLEKRGEVERQLTSALSGLRVQVEAYPDIKSHQELVNLMDKETEIEEKIAYARRFYNTNVMSYNTKISIFPTNIIANIFSFRSEEFFEAIEDEKKDVKVDLE